MTNDHRICTTAWCSEDDPACPWASIAERIGENLLSAIRNGNNRGTYKCTEDAAMACRQVLLEITGENDGPDWVWIVLLKDGRHAYIRGGCDYTGWECQSWLDWHEADSMAEVIALAEEDVRPVLEEMLARGESRRDGTMLSE